MEAKSCPAAKASQLRGIQCINAGCINNYSNNCVNTRSKTEIRQIHKTEPPQSPLPLLLVSWLGPHQPKPLESPPQHVTARWQGFFPSDPLFRAKCLVLIPQRLTEDKNLGADRYTSASRVDSFFDSLTFHWDKFRVECRYHKDTVCPLVSLNVTLSPPKAANPANWLPCHSILVM